jgi:hypothetical protein
MTRTKFIANLLAFSLLLAASAVAGNTNKATLKVSETVSVGGKQLTAGQYQVEWAGSGPNVELTISDGRQTVAKVPAQILPVTKAEARNGYSINTDQAGNKVLTGILFSGKKYQLSIGEASAATATPSDNRPPSN